MNLKISQKFGLSRKGKRVVLYVATVTLGFVTYRAEGLTRDKARQNLAERISKRQAHSVSFSAPNSIKMRHRHEVS